MTKKKARTIAREVVRRLEINDGDFVLIKKGTEVTEDIRLFNALRSAFGATGREKVVLAVVNEFDDVRALDESEMASYGWCKCDDPLRDSDPPTSEG